VGAGVVLPLIVNEATKPSYQPPRDAIEDDHRLETGSDGVAGEAQ
jgi:hypothetical protein